MSRMQLRRHSVRTTAVVQMVSYPPARFPGPASLEMLCHQWASGFLSLPGPSAPDPQALLECRVHRRDNIHHCK